MDLSNFDLRPLTEDERECDECAGTGWLRDEWVEWNNRGMGGPVLHDREEPCFACRGTGMELCCEHDGHPLIACQRDESSAVYCALCVAELDAELDEVKPASYAELRTVQAYHAHFASLVDSEEVAA
jgi:hypothetical protein